MNSARRLAFDREIALALGLMQRGNSNEVFLVLERAHVLGQDDVWPHVLTHWLMLKICFRRGDARGVFGQALRIVLGALGSAIGIVPRGNTGGTNVSMFKRMPIDPELARLMQENAPPS
jgi:hypothetical protein